MGSNTMRGIFGIEFPTLFQSLDQRDVSGPWGQGPKLLTCAPSALFASFHGTEIGNPVFDLRDFGASRPETRDDSRQSRDQRERSSPIVSPFRSGKDKGKGKIRPRRGRG